MLIFTQAPNEATSPMLAFVTVDVQWMIGWFDQLRQGRSNAVLRNFN
eukprot:SAG31_NODE_16319_length_713_cov_1.672638_1_plen_46_part_10